MSISAKGKLHEARFWKVEGDRLACFLCPHHCKIAQGKVGICGVRQNVSGKLYSLIYGKASAVHIDPMEKKPLFHFMPGEPVLSFGSVGCNLRCMHCQNFSISQARVDDGFLENLEPPDVARMALANHCQAVAFTYNEPTIWHEFTYDASKICKEKGVATVYVTNGFIEEEPLREISPYLDAMNVDVKGFREDFYKGICKARLEPVLKATKLAYGLGIHLELTYLVIPTKNDKEEEMRAFCHWVKEELDRKVPVHFSRFHPDYIMTDLPATPSKTMELAHKIGKEEGLDFVYLGNINAPECENTRCPKCNTLVIVRQGFSIDHGALITSSCPKCGEPLNILLKPTK